MRTKKSSRKDDNDGIDWKEQILYRLPEFLLTEFKVLPLGDKSYEALKEIAESMNIPFEDFLEFVRPFIMRHYSDSIDVMIAAHRAEDISRPGKNGAGKFVSSKVAQKMLSSK